MAGLGIGGDLREPVLIGSLGVPVRNINCQSEFFMTHAGGLIACWKPFIR
jgi:hypothetical protein